ADVEVGALRIVRRDEVEAARVGVVDPRRVHESARARRLERLRKLPYGEVPEVGRQRDQALLLQETDHFVLAALVGPQERRLVLRDGGAAGGVRVGDRRV